jgi:hypothetical protein
MFGGVSVQNFKVLNSVACKIEILPQSPLKPVFRKLSAIVDNFIGGRRTLGPLHKIPHNQKYVQVKKRNIIPVVKDTITTFFIH